MKVFITGGTGFIGQSLIRHLLSHNHTITALSRSPSSASTITSLGCTPHPGTLTDLDSLRAAAASADAVLHLAMIHDFHNLDKSFAIDRAAITAMAEGLEGTGKPLIITSDTMVLKYGKLGLETDNDFEKGTTLAGRAESEPLLKKLTEEKGIRGGIVRLAPVVHGKGDRAYTGMLIDLAKKNSAAVYVGDGSQRWAAVHKEDAVEVFRLAMDKGRAGAVYHAVAEEGVTLKDLSETIATHVGVAAESQSRKQAEESLGFMAEYVDADSPASGDITRTELGWTPKQPHLLKDINDNYFTT